MELSENHVFPIVMNETTLIYAVLENILLAKMPLRPIVIILT